MDYEPDTMAELQPMSIAVVRHCFRKNLKVIALTLYPSGPGLVEHLIAAGGYQERIALLGERHVEVLNYGRGVTPVKA